VQAVLVTDLPLAAERRFQMPPTPVLRYSEEPDRTAKNPALRSTSETGFIGVGIVSETAFQPQAEDTITG
jgi:hypothetical protein